MAIAALFMGVGASSATAATQTIFPFVDGTPVAAALLPNNGPEAGGTSVTVTGSGFTGASDVTLDGVSVAFTFVDDATITFVTPAHAPGAVAVVVVDQPISSSPLSFTFTPGSSDRGPETGGTPVTLAGTGFTAATDVSVGGISVPFTVLDDNTVILVTPPHPPGDALIVVLGLGGATLFSATFIYTPVTFVTAVTPNAGVEASGAVVTITGACFVGATAVRFGLVPAVSFTVVDDTTITAVVPAGVGVVSVAVDGAGTCGTGVLPDAYAYRPVPAATALAPDSAPVTGGTLVTITGLGFTGATDVTLGGASVAFTVTSDTTITFTAPAHAAGSVSVVVTSPGGSSNPLAFSFTSAASVTTAELPPTGFPALAAGGLGILVVLLGAAALVIARRRGSFT
ncbi:IPT/TIG domain-containing protein [Cryobacterium sp. MLB-32]|uniref:IPT/TIG domain-containing protein n=1 Tax=Cryobacterium sp. MLB-32 TaxID=1529318 RepID=UPI000691C388|nr:IPT/TIG domain-containing protein [Cryobacterium sp. MLB-32]